MQTLEIIIAVVSLSCATHSASRDDSLLVQGVVAAIQRGKTDTRLIEPESFADMAEIYMVRADRWSSPTRNEKYILHITVLAQAMDLHAVLPDGGVTILDRKLAQIRHGETPLAIWCATSNDKSGRLLHGPRVETSRAGVGELLVVSAIPDRTARSNTYCATKYPEPSQYAGGPPLETSTRWLQSASGQQKWSVIESRSKDSINIAILWWPQIACVPFLVTRRLEEPVTDQ